MHLRVLGTPVRRARNRARYSLTATVAVLALTAGVVPAVAATSAGKDKPVSVWGGHGKAKQPELQVGSNRPPESVASAKPTKREKTWRAYQQQRAASPQEAAPGAVPLAAVPEGQGDVPWHQFSDTRITDSLVVRVDLSTGNLMMAGTAFDISGVGQQLQFTHTYNSINPLYSKTVGASRWWLNYERRLEISDSEVVLHDHSGATLRFTRDDDGTFTTPAGYSKDLVEEDDSTYQVTDRKSGSTDHFDADGVLTAVTDRNDGKITVTQHEGGYKVTDEQTGRWIDLTEDIPGLRWYATDNTGRRATYYADGYGNLTAVKDTTGKKTVFAHDGVDGRVTKVTTPEGRQVRFTYDYQDRVTSMQRFDADGSEGPTWTYSYSAGDPAAEGTTTLADPDEDSTVYHHNDEGEVTKVTDPLGHERSASFDGQHNQTTAVDAMGTGTESGKTTTYGWDDRNNPTSAELPTGATASLSGYQTIAGTDLPGTLKSANGNESDYKYDAKGNTLSVAVTGNEGGTREYTYNDADHDCGGFEGQRCSATDAEDNKTSFTYDDKGNLTKVTPPDPMGGTTYTYDALGRPVTVTNGNGTEVTYTYDDRDRVTQVHTDNTPAVTYSYDGDGNLTRREDSTGVTSYTYDGLSRETVRTLQDGSQTVMAYTASEGNLDYYRDPQGTIDYTYDAANRLTQLKAPDGKVTEFEYNNDNSRTKTTYPGGTVQSVTLDDSQRPQHIKATSPAGTLVDLSYDYSYSAGGASVDGTKIRTKTDHGTGYETSYSYDSAGRFSYAKEMDGSTKNSSWQYCYDKAGNLTSQGITEGCPRGTKYTVNAASQITSKKGDSSG
jgi:YD repeat-containing protein